PTCVRNPALKKARYYSGPSPDGTHFLYYDDGHFYTYEMATGESYNITKDTPTSFVNTEDDHNIVKPPTQPIGWAKDGKSVLISDGWDVWNLPVHGGAGVNLTVDGRKDGIRYRSRVLLDAEEKSMESRGEHKGIDLSGPVYFYIYGESTKKAGIARLDSAKPGLTRLLWDDAEFNRFALHKAKNADVF